MPWHSPTILTRQQLLILSLVSEALLTTYLPLFIMFGWNRPYMTENLVGLTEVYPQQRCTVTPQCTPSESLVTPLQ